jgi:tight adherence protein C
LVKVLAICTSLAVLFLWLGLTGYLNRSRIQDALDLDKVSRRRIGVRVVKALGRIGDRVAGVPVLRDVINYRATGLQLEMAGLSLSAAEFYGLWAVSIAAGLVLPSLADTLLFSHRLPVFIKAVMVLMGAVAPRAFLDSRVNNEQLRFNRDFIRYAEKVLIGVSSGFDFYQVLKRIKKHPGYLYRQIEIMREEIEALVSVDEALDRFADRLNNNMVYGFVNAIKHNIKYGISYGDALMEYVDSLRARRQNMIEAIARQMESKLIIPIVLTVMPAAVVLILVPMAIYIARVLV